LVRFGHNMIARPDIAHHCLSPRPIDKRLDENEYPTFNETIR